MKKRAKRLSRGHKAPRNDREKIEGTKILPESENSDEFSKVETLYASAFNSPDMNDISEKTMRKLIRKRSNKPIHYRLVCISLYNKDIVRLEQLLRHSRRLGYSKANKSQIIRFALSKVNITEMPQMY